MQHDHCMHHLYYILLLGVQKSFGCFIIVMLTFLWTIIQPVLQYTPLQFGITRGEILKQPGLKSMAKALCEGQIN